jgi:hypothetical protein
MVVLVGKLRIDQFGVWKENDNDSKNTRNGLQLKEGVEFETLHCQTSRNF